MTNQANNVIATAIALMYDYNKNTAMFGSVSDAELIEFGRNLKNKGSVFLAAGVSTDAVDAGLLALDLLIDSTDLVNSITSGKDMADTIKSLAEGEIITAVYDNLRTKDEEPIMTATEAPATTTEADTIKVSAAHEAALNAVLAIATDGKIKDVNNYFKDVAARDAELTETKKKLFELMTSASRPAMPTSGTTSVGADELTYTVVTRKACDLFVDGSGKKAKGMSFDIPTLVWTDKAGNPASHPEVPDVDPNYDFDLIHVMQFLTGVNLGMNSWLFGHTGTGKSTFVEQVAARIGMPVTRVNLDSNLERADLVGNVKLIQDGGATVTKFEEGILPRAMQRPGFLLMDEIDAGRPDILFVVQRALENKGLMLTEDGGRIVHPHPMFRFAATANTRGQGDEYGMYPGTRTMNASMIDRFTCFIEFDYMNPAREAVLLSKLCPTLDPSWTSKLAQFAHEIRTAFGKGEVYNTISPRGLTTMATTFVTFTSTLSIPEANALQIAMDMSVLNKVTKDTRQKFVEIAQRVFGVKTKAK